MFLEDRWYTVVISNSSKLSVVVLEVFGMLESVRERVTVKGVEGLGHVSSPTARRHSKQ